jgi:death-on-curing protein
MFDDDPEWDLAILGYIHDHIIDASGGAKGFHNEGLIMSALARPMHSVMGEDAYGDVFLKAAALLDAIARNHGFRDGNKRTAMAAAVLYLSQNEVEVTFTNQEYEDIMLHVVNDKPSIEEIKEWLTAHVSSRS